MTRGRWVWDKEKKKFVDFDEYKKPAPEAHFVLTDDMPPTQSMATLDAPVFTSKAKLRQHYKEHGYVETGGDHLTRKPLEPYKPDPKEIRDTVAKALNDIKYGNAPFTEREKELCKQEQRKLEAYRRNH